MTTIIANKDVRTIALGIQVSRPTNTLPQTATAPIFTVTGGRILVVALIGEVTTVFGATATNLSVVTAPSVGSATTLASTLAVASAAVGQHFSLPGTPGGALVTDTGGGVADTLTSAILVPIGSISLTTSASNTGSAKWDLVYIPFDNGAQVAFA